jgi:hypothetical protein
MCRLIDLEAPAPDWLGGRGGGRATATAGDCRPGHSVPHDTLAAAYSLIGQIADRVRHAEPAGEEASDVAQ